MVWRLAPGGSPRLVAAARRPMPVIVTAMLSCCPPGLSMKRSAQTAGLSTGGAGQASGKRLRPGLAPQAARPPGGASSQQADKGLWLVVGLGNPGAQYARTRHNVGFMVVDELARCGGIDVRKLEKSAAVGRGTLCGQDVLLAKPVTFMNNSGEAVAALARFYKVPPHRVLVIADDLDIPHAALRVRPKGGHGGHNGLRSIVQHLGNTQDFPRIKIGIGRPAGQLSIASWVLQDFTAKEMESVQVTVAQACDVVRAIMSQGLDRAISTAAPSAKPAAAPQTASLAARSTGSVAVHGVSQEPQRAPNLSPASMRAL